MRKRNYSYVIDETDEMKIVLKDLLGNLKQGMTNTEIKSLSQKYVDILEKLVFKSENYLKGKGGPALTQQLNKINKIIHQNE